MNNWKNKFIILGSAQAISMLTSSVLQMSVVWHLTLRTESAIVITMATLCSFMPRAALGMFSGAFIDRFDRKKVLILSDLFIALAALALAVAFFFTETPIGFIYLILSVRSAGAAFHSPCLNSIIPSIVPKDQITRCAGISQGFDSISLILSPAIAAILYNFWDIGFVVLLDVFGALVAIVTAYFLLTSGKSQGSCGSETFNVLRDTKDGIHALRKQKGMISILIISTIYAFIYFPIGSMYPLITIVYFEGSVADSSIVEMVFSGGTLIGAILLAYAGNRINKVKAIACSIGIYGIGAVYTGLLSPSGLFSFMIISGIMGISIPFFHGSKTAIFQNKIPDEYLGRALSLSHSVSLFAAPLGLLFGGSFSAAVGVNYCFFVCGILAILLSASVLIMPATRRLEM
ncbi:MAG: MFS transporter [Eubacteriales bacterium]|nr:MFS transporter [Eubacteriales bacterium]MDD4389853.1 MFS transporter [Eubacteriales bacterium]